MTNQATDYSALQRFRVNVEAGVADIVIDHAPINLMDQVMMLELNKMGKLLESDDAVKVIVFRSERPGFFVAHADLYTLLEYRHMEYDTSELTPLNRALHRFRSMPKICIAQIEGQCCGGGSEIALAMDMRFAAIGKGFLSQIETPLGMTPGAGGCSRLPDLVGRARALEVALGFAEFPAELAERYGYINRALPADEIGDFVATLARRIASNTADVIAQTKKAIDKETDPAIERRMVAEQEAYYAVVRDPEVERRCRMALNLGLQTLDAERGGIDGIMLQLGEKL